jgi:uroporphyrinogen decarboxylase
MDPLSDAAAISALSVTGLTERLAPVYETVSRLANMLPEEVALIGFAGAPWTVALYMVEGRGGSDGTRARTWAYAEPNVFAVLIDVLVEATVRHLSAQIRHGAEAVQLFDSWAGLLAAEQFRRWVIAPTAEIVGRLRTQHPGVPIIGFPRGAGVLYGEYVRSTGVDAVGIDAAVPIAWAAETLQTQCAVQGNLDNVLLRAGGAELDEATDRLVETLGRGPFVFNLGHGILPDTPPEHVIQVAARLRALKPE